MVPLQDPRCSHILAQRHTHYLQKLEQWRRLDLGREVLHKAVSVYPQRSVLLNNVCFNAQTGTQKLLAEGQCFMRK